MEEMKALVVRISFFEAFFKVHYTKGFRLTYPIPLPSSVAGIFGAMLGIPREELKKEFDDMFFGAKLINYDGIVTENATLFQYGGKVFNEAKKYGIRPITVTQLAVINEPTYLIAIAGNSERIKNIESKIEKGIVYLPYGGQNDFFVKDWRIAYLDEIEKGKEVTNYAPRDITEHFEMKEDSEIFILPVKHQSKEDIGFYFVINGKLRLKVPIYVTQRDKIGIYTLNFNY